MTLEAVETALTSVGMHLPVLAKPISTGVSPLHDNALAQTVSHCSCSHKRLEELVMLCTNMWSFRCSARPGCRRA